MFVKHEDRPSEGSSHGLKRLRLLIVLGSSPASVDMPQAWHAKVPQCASNDRWGETARP